MKQLFIVGLLIVIFFQFFQSVYIQKNKFFNKGYESQYELYKKAYYSSQYATKQNPGIIPDETFESFAAGAFLKGLNPIRIVHDHPPLGRYIIALSIYFFDNQHTIIIPLLLVSCLGIFLLGRLITHSTILALLPLVFFANEPLFLNKLLYTPLPEPVQLPFIIFSFYFFVKGITTKKYRMWFGITAFMLGAVISTRFFVLGGTIVASMIGYFLWEKEKRNVLVTFLMMLPISLLVLIASYTRTMQDGYNVLQIFGIQKYILAYHKSKFILPFSFWDLLLFNRWHTWWGERKIITDPQWNIVWPITVFISFLGYLLSVVKKIQLEKGEKVLLLWIVFFSCLLSTGYTSTRYFLPLLPFVYIISVALGKKIFYLVKHHEN